MSAQTLDYVIILSQGLIIALLGYSLIIQGRGLLQPEERIKSATRMIYTGLALALVGFIIGLIAALLIVRNMQS
jgi:hypothetical protein